VLTGKKQNFFEFSICFGEVWWPKKKKQQKSWSSIISVRCCSMPSVKRKNKNRTYFLSICSSFCIILNRGKSIFLSKIPHIYVVLAFPRIQGCMITHFLLVVCNSGSKKFEIFERKKIVFCVNFWRFFVAVFRKLKTLKLKKKFKKKKKSHSASEVLKHANSHKKLKIEGQKSALCRRGQNTPMTRSTYVNGGRLQKNFFS